MLAVNLGVNLALGGAYQAHDGLHQSTLTVAVGAQQSHSFSIVHGDTDTIQHRDRTVACMQVLDMNFSRQGKSFPPMGRATPLALDRRQFSFLQQAPPGAAKKQTPPA